MPSDTLQSPGKMARRSTTSESAGRVLNRPDIAAGIGYVDGLVGDRSRPKLWKFWTTEARLSYSIAKTYSAWLTYQKSQRRYVSCATSLIRGTTLALHPGSMTRRS